MIATASLFAGTASAQSVTSGFYLDGNVQGEYQWADNDTYRLSMADITLGFSGAAAGNIALGFEVDFLAIEGDDITIDPRFTGSVYFESSFGRLSIGLPRVALDDYVATAGLGGSKLNELELGSTFGSAANDALLYGDASYDYGWRFDSTTQGVNFSLSYHTGNETDAVVTGALRFDFAEIYAASAGFEIFDESGVEHGVFGSVSADYGIFGGLVSIASPTGSNEMVYAAEMFYEPSENIDFVTGYISVDGENMFSFDAEYTFMKNAYVGASVLGDFTGDPRYTVYAGWNVNFRG